MLVIIVEFTLYCVEKRVILGIIKSLAEEASSELELHADVHAKSMFLSIFQSVYN